MRLCRECKSMVREGRCDACGSQEVIEGPGPAGGPSPAMKLLLLALGALLAGVIVPNFIRARAQGRMTACPSNMKNIGTALEMYSADHGGLYARELADLTPRYLKTVPSCPGAGRDSYSEHFRSTSSLYTVVCYGENHRAAGVEGHYPQYTSAQGLIRGPDY